MSTNALIIFKNCNNLCNCISVNFDGYIKNGVGETLYNFWYNNNDVKKLCFLNKKIRCFGSSIKTIEFYEENIKTNKRIKQLKNLEFEQAQNEANNYCYAYIWEEENPGWKLLKENSMEWIYNILNY